MTNARLSPAQAGLLDKIVCAEVEPGHGGFADLRTVNALLRKGLIVSRPIPRDTPENTMLAAMGCEELVATPAGCTAIANMEADGQGGDCG